MNLRPLPSRRSRTKTEGQIKTGRHGLARVARGKVRRPGHHVVPCEPLDRICNCGGWADPRMLGDTPGRRRDYACGSPKRRRRCRPDISRPACVRELSADRLVDGERPERLVVADTADDDLGQRVRLVPAASSISGRFGVVDLPAGGVLVTLEQPIQQHIGLNSNQVIDLFPGKVRAGSRDKRGD